MAGHLTAQERLEMAEKLGRWVIELRVSAALMTRRSRRGKLRRLPMPCLALN